MNLIICVHLKKILARRILRQGSAVNASSIIQPVEVTACPEFIEGPSRTRPSKLEERSRKAWISVDWLILSMAIGCGVNLQAMDDNFFNIPVVNDPTDVVVMTTSNMGASLNQDPMAAAISQGNIEWVKSLIDQSQDKNRSIENALFAAGRYGQREMALFLLNTYPIASSQLGLSRLLNGAAANGNVDLVKLALERGANIEGSGEKTLETPLLQAAGLGRTQIAKYLIEQGANVNAGTFATRSTPLGVALRDNHLTTTRVLLTTIPLSEAQKIKAAVASIRFGTSFPRDIRNMVTIKLIRLFTQQHMAYAQKLLDDAEFSSGYLPQRAKQAIANLRESQSWNAIRQEVETNFRRVLARPLQRAGVPQLMREQQEAGNAPLKTIEAPATSEKAATQGEALDDEELAGLLEGIENMSDEEMRDLERKLGTIFK
jgi:hypothetical protein